MTIDIVGYGRTYDPTANDIEWESDASDIAKTDQTAVAPMVAGYMVSKRGRVTARTPLHAVDSNDVYLPEDQTEKPANRKKIKSFSSQYVDTTVILYKVANGEVVVDQYADEPEPIADMHVAPEGTAVIDLDN